MEKYSTYTRITRWSPGGVDNTPIRKCFVKKHPISVMRDIRAQGDSEYCAVPKFPCSVTHTVSKSSLSNRLEQEIIEPAAKLIYYKIKSQNSLDQFATIRADNESAGNVLLSENYDAHEGNVVFKKICKESAEIGLVDVTLPERKQIDFVTKHLHVSIPELELCCQLFNKPECIQNEHLGQLNSVLERLSSLKTKVLPIVLMDLQTNSLLTSEGANNILRLLSNSTELQIEPLTRAEVQCFKPTKLNNKLNKFMCPPYNTIPAAKLSSMLERLLNNCHLTFVESEKLTIYVYELLQLCSSNSLKSFLKMLINNSLLTRQQMKLFLELLKRQNQHEKIFTDGFFEFDNFCAVNVTDLVGLLKRWPRVNSRDEMKRLRNYLQNVNAMKPKKRKIFLKAIKSTGNLNFSKLESLRKLVSDYNNGQLQGKLVLEYNIQPKKKLVSEYNSQPKKKLVSQYNSQPKKN